MEAVKSVWNLPRGEKNKKILKNDCPPLEIFSERDILSLNVAEMAELVDALGSGPSPRKRVEVRVFFWAPLE